MPVLAEYIYVFDYSSKDAQSIEKLLTVSDGVVIWGGDEAIRAVRKMTQPNTKIIEWGHKISFAYLTRSGMTDTNLKCLAQNICVTNQLLCSSCQGILLDTDELENLYDFCDRFLPILEDTAQEFPASVHLSLQAQIILQLYTESLLSPENKAKVFKGRLSGIIAYEDNTLQSAFQFRNCWAKRMHREELLPGLKKYKNHLQTVALLCGSEEKGEIINLLAKSGAVRITDGFGMSASYCGMPHDGEYPLRRYIKTVSVEL